MQDLHWMAIRFLGPPKWLCVKGGLKWSRLGGRKEVTHWKQLSSRTSSAGCSPHVERKITQQVAGVSLSHTGGKKRIGIPTIATGGKGWTDCTCLFGRAHSYMAMTQASKIRASWTSQQRLVWWLLESLPGLPGLWSTTIKMHTYGIFHKLPTWFTSLRDPPNPELFWWFAHNSLVASRQRCSQMELPS